MAASDLVCVSLQFVEHSSAAAMYNDLDFAYQLQLDEALAASEGLDYESWSASKGSSSREPFAHDVSIAHQIQSRELERRQQELVDKEVADVETRSVTQNLQQRAHDLEFARSIAETPEEEWEEVGDTLEQPFEAEGDLSATDCGQEFEMDIQGVKSDGGQLGVGCILMDPAGSVVWQQSKYLGQGLSWHAGEYTGLLEGMAMAEKLGLKRLWVHASSRVVVNQVNGHWKPKLSNQVKLLSSVLEAQMKFASFKIGQAARAPGARVSQLAHAAITRHLAGEASTSHGNRKMKGLQLDVRTHASTSTGLSYGPTKNLEKAKVENCLICFEDKSPSEMATLKDCLHTFCVVCMNRHAEVQVQASQVPVRCPQTGCLKVLKLEECQPFLTRDMFNVLSKRLVEASVPDGERVYCPFSNCSALMDKSTLNSQIKASTSASNNKELIRRVACIECRRIFCMDCRVPWHFGRSCIDYQNLPPELRDSEDSNLYKLAKNENWQRCRKCRRMIELSEGCYHMTCRCGYEFCYTCGAEWKNKTQSCTCKLWDERNIVRDPLNSDDESDEEYDQYEDEEEDVDEEMDEDYSDYEDEGSELDVSGGSLLDRTITLFDAFPRPRHPCYKTKLCRYNMRGNCTAGNLCSFAHGEEELRHL